MTQLPPSAFGALFNTTRISAATAGAQASITSINPAAGVSASQLQQEANALAQQRSAAASGLAHPPAAPLPPAPEDAAKSTALQDKPKAGAEAAAAAGAAKSSEAAESAAPAPASETAASAAPKEAAPLPTTETNHYEKKILGMLKALMQLTSQPDAQQATALILLSGNGSVGVSVRAPAVTELRTGAGNDAITVQAKSVQNVATGAGADSVAIDAEVVDNVRTDPGRGGGNRYQGDWRSWNFAKTGGGGGGSDDALSVRARHASNLFTGGGDDAIAVQAGTVNNLRAGRGDDAITVEATLVTGIRGGAGDDAITVSAERSLETPKGERGWMSEFGWRPFRDPVDVDGGKGDDSITLQTRGSLTARGGKGDDEIHLQGGNIALSYQAGDGDDTVTLADGANVVLNLRGIEGYAVTRDEDSLTINFGEDQSITFENLSAGGAIAVSQGGEGVVEMLHQPQRLDLSL